MDKPEEQLSAIQAAAINELIQRKRMSTRIFRPQPHQDEVFKNPATYTLVEGGNRSGKSLTTQVFLAALALDEQITLSTGETVEARLPHQKGRPLLIWIVCIDLRHIGRAIYPMLFKAGAFKVCVDPITKQLRPYCGDEDEALGITPKPAPPLIPSRYIEHIAWENKAEDIFSRVVLRNPSNPDEILAEICAYTSKGDAPQGVAVDHIAVEEQLAGDRYTDELIARLVDKKGRMTWASWPDTESAELEKFAEMLDKNIKAGRTDIAKRVRLTMSGNKALPQKAVEEFLAGCHSEEERMARDQGLFLTDRLRMYPLFDPRIHNALGYEDDVAEILRRRDGLAPNDWTKYLVLDPGTSHPCVLLAAVPPPELGDYLVVYQEFYPGRMDPMQLAQHIRKHTRGERFYKFLIDKRAGRSQTMGLANTVRHEYSKAFRANHIKCELTGYDFVFASDNVGARQLATAVLMHPNQKNIPKLRVVEKRCPHLCDQLKKVKKKTIKKEVDEERKAKGAHDAVDCLEYLVAAGPRFFELPPDPSISPAFVRYMNKYGNKKKERQAISIGTRY